MTLGIVTTLSDSVLFVADGRERHAIQGDINTDDKNKFLSIGRGNVGLIGIGVAEVTEFAEGILRRSTLEMDITQVCREVQRALAAGWEDVLPRMPASINLQDRKIHATFLIGGVIDGQPFVTSIPSLPFSSPAFPIFCEAFAFVANIERAANLYHEGLAKTLGEDPSGTEPILDVLKLGEQIIRHTEAFDCYVGGTVRFSQVDQSGVKNCGKLS